MPETRSEECRQSRTLQEILLASGVTNKWPIYSFKLFKWRRIGPVGVDKEPCARSGHRMVYHDSCLYTFGGYNPSLEPPVFKEVWEYCLGREEWKKKSLTGDVGSNIASHAAVVVNDNLSRTSPRARMLVYGGTTFPFGSSLSTKIFLCDLSNFHWQILSRHGGKPHHGMSLPDPRAPYEEASSEEDDDDDSDYIDFEDFDLAVAYPEEDRPFALYGQSVAIVDTDEGISMLYSVGGTNGVDYTMDVDRFCFETLTWEKCYSTGLRSRPLQRYRHELCILDRKIYVLGGGTETVVCDFIEIWYFDTRKRGEKGKGAWDCITSLPDTTVPIIDSFSEQYPAPRRCHECVQKGKYGYVFGGYDGSRILGDIWRLDLTSFQWKQLPCPLPEPVLFSSSAISPAGQIFQMGGVSNMEEKLRTNQLHSIWIDVPSLRDMAWEAVLHYLPGISKLDENTLRSSGIPCDLLRNLRRGC